MAGAILPRQRLLFAGMDFDGSCSWMLIGARFLGSAAWRSLKAAMEHDGGGANVHISDAPLVGKVRREELYYGDGR